MSRDDTVFIPDAPGCKPMPWLDAFEYQRLVRPAQPPLSDEEIFDRWEEGE